MGVEVAGALVDSEMARARTGRCVGKGPPRGPEDRGHQAVHTPGCRSGADGVRGAASMRRESKGPCGRRGSRGGEAGREGDQSVTSAAGRGWSGVPPEGGGGGRGRRPV